MGKDAGFLQDIIANPDDDAPRLIYADWLDEHGQHERAKFIRIQIALANLPEDNDRYSELQAQERRLYVTHSRHWHPFRRNRFQHAYPRFRRGFVEGLWLVKPSEFLRDAAKIVRTHPVRDLYLQIDEEGWGPELARCPHLSRLTTLRVTGVSWDRVTATDLLAMTASPHLTSLLALDIFSADVDDEGFRELIGVGKSALPVGLARLERLSFGEGRLTDEAVTALVSSPLAHTLTTLSLYSHGGTTQRFRTLVESPLWPRLESLRLADLWHEDPTTLSALTKGISRSRLRELSVDRFIVAGGSERRVVAEALAAAASWGPLRALNLSSMELSGEGFRTLLNCPHLAGLKRLYLNETELEDEDVQAIAACPYLGNLNHLMLGGDAPRSSRFGDNALKALAQSPYLTSLTVLDVSDSFEVTESGIEALACSPNVSRLRLLGFRANDAGVRAIGNSSQLGRLTNLYLQFRGEQDLSDDCVEALVRSPNLPHLTYLWLPRSYLSVKGKQALLEAKQIAWPGLSRSDAEGKKLRTLFRSRFDREYFWEIEDDALYFPWYG